MLGVSFICFRDLLLGGFSGKRRFADLSDKEILALAISSEEEDSRIYRAYAETLRADYPGSAAVFDGMAAEEDQHRRWLLDLYKRRYGDVVIPLHREHVSDFYTRRPVWLIENLGLERIRQEVADMEREAEEFYMAAAAKGLQSGNPQAPGATRPSGGRSRGRRGKARRALPERSGSRRRGPAFSAPVHSHMGAAWSSRTDGRLSINPGSDLCDRVRDPQSLDDFSGRAFSVHRRWDLHGLHGGCPRRRQNLRTRLTVEARPRLGRDDRDRRIGPRPPYLIPDFLDRDGRRLDRRLLRAVGHRLDSEQIHGDTIPPRCLPGRPGRSIGPRGGHPDRRSIVTPSNRWAQRLPFLAGSPADQDACAPARPPHRSGRSSPHLQHGA